MKISITEESEYVVMTIEEANTISLIKVPDLNKAIESSNPNVGNKKIILNFYAVNHVDSSVIGWLFQLNKSILKLQNTKVRLILNNTLRKHLTIVKAESYLLLINSMEEALATL